MPFFFFHQPHFNIFHSILIGLKPRRCPISCIMTLRRPCPIKTCQIGSRKRHSGVESSDFLRELDKWNRNLLATLGPTIDLSTSDLIPNSYCLQSSRRPLDPSTNLTASSCPSVSGPMAANSNEADRPWI